VEWQCPLAHFSPHSPIETILYSLSKGKDELILFGGMELESQLNTLKAVNNDDLQHKVSKKMFILKPKGLHITSS
ncbi:hypothetical protein BpHYR1_022941, partial [Brachionus plicatilis]